MRNDSFVVFKHSLSKVKLEIEFGGQRQVCFESFVKLLKVKMYELSSEVGNIFSHARETAFREKKEWFEEFAGNLRACQGSRKLSSKAKQGCLVSFIYSFIFNL